MNITKVPEGPAHSINPCVTIFLLKYTFVSINLKILKNLVKELTWCLKYKINMKFWKNGFIQITLNMKFVSQNLTPSWRGYWHQYDRLKISRVLRDFAQLLLAQFHLHYSGYQRLWKRKHTYPKALHSRNYVTIKVNNIGAGEVVW